jgi:hypothetical protein
LTGQVRLLNGSQAPQLQRWSRTGWEVDLAQPRREAGSGEAFTLRTAPDPALPLELATAPGLGARAAALRAGLAALTGLLALLALAQLALSIELILQPREVMYGESFVYDHAARLVRGEPLYQPLDRAPYTVANYGPLYYVLAAGLQLLLGPGFWSGRTVSLCAGLVTAGLVAWVAARRSGDRRVGAIAGLLFLTLGLPYQYLWSALYRVDLLGVALSLGAVALLLTGTDRRRVVAAGVLAAAAVLTKQTFLAAALACALWLWRHDRRAALLFIGTSAPIVLVAVVALEAATGAFLANVVFMNVNPFLLSYLLSNLASFFQLQAGPVLVAALFAIERLRTGPTADDELLTIYWLAAWLPVLGLGKAGASQNYWIELAAITAVLAALGSWSRLQDSGPRRRWTGFRRALVPLLLLGATALPVATRATLSLPPLLAEVWPSSTYTRDLAAVVDRVRAEPGDVLAEPADVVVLAGRPILLEPAHPLLILSQSAWDLTPLTREICSGRVRLLVLGYSLESGGREQLGYVRWPTSILAALRQTMVLEDQRADRFLYSWRAPNKPHDCAPA